MCVSYEGVSEKLSTGRGAAELYSCALSLGFSALKVKFF
jgi:hypothetical protein